MPYRAVKLNKGRMAITAPAQSTLCTLGHRAVPRLVSGLNVAYLFKGFWSEKNSLISVSVQIARHCFQRSTWNVLPRVTTSWGLNTLRLNIISKLFDRTKSQWNCNLLYRNCHLAPPTWPIMRDLIRCTRSEHLNVKMVSKIKITAHLANN